MPYSARSKRLDPILQIAKMQKQNEQIMKVAQQISPEAAQAQVKVKKFDPPDFMPFFLKCWKTLEPSNAFQAGPHHYLLAEYLTLIAEDRLEEVTGKRNLLVNIAPRFAKSRMFTIIYPLWCWLAKDCPPDKDPKLWLRDPHKSVLFLSYSAQLSNTFNEERRKIIQSDWYQEICGFELSAKKNRMSEYENTVGGLHTARGLDGTVLGVGGDMIIADDPNKPEAGSETEAIMERSGLRFSDYSITRRNQPKAPVVVIQQRVSPRDISGIIQKDLYEDYHQIILPTIAFEDEEHIFPISGKVFKRKKGDFLQPKRFGPKENAVAVRTMTESSYSGRHLQRPTNPSGALLKRHWMRRYYARPKTIDKIAMVVDTAGRGKDHSDPWSIQVYGYVHGVEAHYLLDVYTARMSFPDGQDMIMQLAKKWKPRVCVIENKASGMALIEQFNRPGSGFRWPIDEMNPSKDKLIRMLAITPYLKAGKLYLPNDAPWLADFEQEIFTFPDGCLNDDQADCLSMYFEHFHFESDDSWTSALTM